MASEPPPNCPLCAVGSLRFFHEDARRRYLWCSRCDLVSVDPTQLPTPDVERTEYDLHQNRVDDSKYRAFLSRAFEPLVARVKPRAKGLDFGCGPGPALAAMFREAGYEMAVYDPIYAPDISVLRQKYDFVTCTEVIEHVHRPQQIWAQLVSMLKPPGCLLIMTQRVTSPEAFRHWRYKDDVTHVGFYSERTFRFLASAHGCSLALPGPDVAILER